ncbi:hypothetical protein HQ496_04580 [bacterium]|nr:hypothetical protein [bacterium]
MKSQTYMRAGFNIGVPFLLIMLFCGLTFPGCDSQDPDSETSASQFNLKHLDSLGETVTQNEVTYRFVHIYSEAPNYGWVGDEDEGIAALDDAARAAVVYLRHFELTGDSGSADKAKQLIRFVMKMQRSDGLFYNFIFDNALTINTTHQNSRADAFQWWAGRGVWALGVCAQVFEASDPTLSKLCETRIRLTYPYLQQYLSKYGTYTVIGGRRYPLWLVDETASDATSELLLGLISLNRAYPDGVVQEMIDRFSDGVATMQYGSLSVFPYGSHASWQEIWHGWGNSQTMAVSEAGRPASAIFEADNFYARLLVYGFLHSIPFDNPNNEREFEQIAYATRAIAVGLVKLSEATSDRKYAVMAGLAASWFTGNNVAGEKMYDPATGRGYDGIGPGGVINRNAGAESTIEAVFTILEIENNPVAREWMSAKGGAVQLVTKVGKDYSYRVFTIGAGAKEQRLGLILNLTDQKSMIYESVDLDQFLANGI